ncbi:MAG: hypothetical protein MUC28_00210 [Planctomycetes bacterium]|jgi:hypothetical protein|nr:hypothetical protein [Planctomycetota bacterium]
MKKTLTIIAIIIILGGAGYLEYRRRQVSQPAEIPAAPDTGGITMKDSLLRRLQSGLMLDCHVVTTAVEDFIILAKDGNIRIDGFSALFATGTDVGWIYVAEGDWVYVWSGDTGVKVNRTLLAGSDQAVGGTAAKYDWEKLVAGWEEEQAKFSCKEAKLSDNLFVRPETTGFTDITNSPVNLKTE